MVNKITQWQTYNCFPKNLLLSYNSKQAESPLLMPKVLGTRRKTLHPSRDRVFHQHDSRVSVSSAAQEGHSQEEDDATKLASQVIHTHMLVSKLCVVPLTLANMSRLTLVCYRLEVVWAQAVLQWHKTLRMRLLLMQKTLHNRSASECHSTSNHLHCCVALHACSVQLTAIFASIQLLPPLPFSAFRACTSEKLQQQQEPAAAMFGTPYLSTHIHTLARIIKLKTKQSDLVVNVVWQLPRHK